MKNNLRTSYIIGNNGLLFTHITKLDYDNHSLIVLLSVTRISKST